MDKATLENTIKHECEETLAAIREDEAEQIRRLDMQCRAAIDSVRKTTADATDEHVRQETIRLENKAGLERQKIKLQSIEAFVDRLVNDVMNEMQKHPRYRPFLLAAIENAANEISGRAEVRLAAADLAMDQEIRTALKNDGVTIVRDPSIRWGGCLVVDDTGGRIFNNTLERIYFRKSPAIRLKIAEILEKEKQE